MEMHGMLGERLGVIGQQQVESTIELPAWKKDFLSLPSISVRRGIAWSYKPPYEDTDTLVLTAPSGKFVDIRFPKDLASPDKLESHSSFWAFSGLSKTTFPDAVPDETQSLSMSYVAHCKFDHDIDSRGPGISDEGDMFLLANGDVAEMGMMTNPTSGNMELYKEYWTSPASSPEVTSTTSAENVSKSPTMVAELKSATSRGLAIRVGSYFQAIIETSQGVAVQRQTLNPSSSSSQADGESWRRDSRSNASLPTEWLCSPVRKQGDSVEHEGILWKVTEYFA